MNLMTKYNIYIKYIKMPSDNPKIKKALKDGKISQKQYDKLPEKLLVGIVNSKKKSPKKTNKGKK
jgi:hypothetical protein